MDDFRLRSLPDRARLTVGVVGAGRVGAVLGAALDAAGHRVVGASGLSDVSRRRILDLLPGVPMHDVEDVVRTSELVLLTVPSPDLPGLVEGLSRRGVWQAGQIVVHTDAQHGIEVFDPALPFHVLPVAWHPAMRFTGTLMDLDRLPEASVAVTTTDAVRPIGEALVIEMGAEPVWIAADDRPAYAAAVVHAASHLPVLVEQAAQILDTAHVGHSRRLLATLMLTAIEDSLRSPERGTHLDALKDEEALAQQARILDEIAPDSHAVHLALTRAAASRAFATGRIGEDRINRLLDVLGSARPS